MKKKEITYTGLVKVMMAKARKDVVATGEQFDTKGAFSSAAARWKKIKDGVDDEFSQGRAVLGMKRKSKKTKGADSKSIPDKSTMIDDILSKVDLCDECKSKIKEFVGKPSKSKGTRKRKL